MSISNIIEKVKKLLALSQSSNAHEAAAAAAKANALIDEYRLSVGQLQDTSNEDPLTHDQSEPLLQADRAMRWRKTLAQALTKHYGCYIWNNTARRTVYYVVAGRKSDVEVLRYMFAYISLECERITQNQAKGRGRTFAESYRRGFVDGVLSQLQASRATAVKASSDPMALVKLDDRAKDAEALVKGNVRLEKGKKASYSRTDANAFYSGQSAGKALHLGSGLPGAKTRLLSQ
jgi:hypothetical protein